MQSRYWLSLWVVALLGCDSVSELLGLAGDDEVSSAVLTGLEHDKTDKADNPLTTGTSTSAETSAAVEEDKDAAAKVEVKSACEKFLKVLPQKKAKILNKLATWSEAKAPKKKVWAKISKALKGASCGDVSIEDEKAVVPTGVDDKSLTFNSKDDAWLFDLTTYQALHGNVASKKTKGKKKKKKGKKRRKKR
jgi:hypothetical protein